MKEAGVSLCPWRRLVMVLVGCACWAIAPGWPAHAEQTRADDPFERFNRTTYALNQSFAAWLPAISLSGAASPVSPDVFQGINNVFINLREPIAAASSLVAGNIGSAWNSTSRFAINSTLGLLGSQDVAAAHGYPSERNDIGLEVCRNGFLREPIFIQIPILGPANLRDIGAQIATNIAIFTAVGGWVFYPYYVLDRLDMYYERRAAAGAGAAPIDDPYAAQRDAYLDGRRARCDALTTTIDRR